jgi:leucyl-tRNA synthetase
MNQNEYNPSKIEKKWQHYWDENNIYKVENKVKGKENFYALSEFSYPSGNLHVGHWYAFAVPDIYARFKRMSGYNVLYPMGFDSFGLPAENAAIKRGLDPRKWTYENMEYMKGQLKNMGAMFDWDRTLATSDPEYYKWTQWMFTKFYENDLIKRSLTKTNWCESCKTVLANEQVTAGLCERCDNQVIQKDMAQWMLKITEFADELHDDLDTLDWDHSIKQAQREWIGRKEGSLIPFALSNGEKIKVFTTRADTLFGATYVVLAPEHTMVQNLKAHITNWHDVEKYLVQVFKKSDLDRQQSKEKTGVELKGISAMNPATGKQIPVWIADYVLAHFGTAAVMAVPAHDERDAEFAIKYDLPFKFVVLPSAGEIGSSRPLITVGENAFILSAGTTEKKGSQEQINAEWNAMYDVLGTHADGILPVGKRFCCSFEGKVINSASEVNTKTTEESKKIITKIVGGEITRTYRLRDWGISRQRYWGTPIPIVYDPQGNPHVVSEEHLPWILPDDVDFTPDGTAPLARSQELLERTEKIFGKGWTPEVDTMDTFVDSSWYFYRYLDNKNRVEFASEESMKSWMPVNIYFGGAAHTTMHLLYSRFWVKALHRLGLVPHNEPYKGRLNRGLILGPDGAKMSKSKGNVIDPDQVVSHVGADTVRMYLAFIGPFNEPGNYPWDPNGVVGIKRFLERVWRLGNAIVDTTDSEMISELHRTIKKVSEDIDKLKLNTAISAMMSFLNKVEKSLGISQSDYIIFIQLLAPFAPHMSEELWMQHHTISIHMSDFPKYDKTKILSGMKTLAIQINGKVRGEIVVDKDEDSDVLKGRVIALPDIQKWIQGKEIKNFIYIPEKIINVVII